MSAQTPAPCRGSSSCTSMNCPLSGFVDGDGVFHPVCSKQARTVKAVKVETEQQSE